MVSARISPCATSSQPDESREAWWPEWRMHNAPMCTPRVCFRITAYHSVVASPEPWIRCQGGGGPSMGSAMPSSASCRPVAT